MCVELCKKASRKRVVFFVHFGLLVLRQASSLLHERGRTVLEWTAPSTCPGINPRIVSGGWRRRKAKGVKVSRCPVTVHRKVKRHQVRSSSRNPARSVLGRVLYQHGKGCRSLMSKQIIRHDTCKLQLCAPVSPSFGPCQLRRFPRFVACLSVMNMKVPAVLLHSSVAQSTALGSLWRLAH